MAFRESNSTLGDSTIDEHQKSDINLDEGFNYDKILEHLGQMGKFQLHTFLWLCLPAVFPSIVLMSYTFTGNIPNYRCFIEGCDDFTNSSEINPFIPNWLNNTIPWNSKNTHDQCHTFNYTWTNVGECQEPGNSIDIKMVRKCDRWVYDQSLFRSTIVTEFNLTCDDEWKQTLVGTVYMFGMLLGAAVVGSAADAIGRKLTYTINVFAMATVMTAMAFSPNFATFSVLRFFCGATAVGHNLIVFVWGVETVGSKYRALVGFIFTMIFAAGAGVLGLVAYYVRDWKHLQLIISVPMFALVGIYWIVPESIRWLISKKRYQEAHNLILKVANINKKIVPKHLIQFPNENCSTATGISVIEDIITENTVTKVEKNYQMNITEPNNKKMSESIMDVFRSLILLKRLVILSFAWTAILMGYYGINFSVTNLSENFFLNYELTMVIEIPACIAGIFVIDKIGRRNTLSGGLIFCGIACLIAGVLPEDYATVRVVFSVIGKLFISCVVGTAMLLTSDLFPTPARSAAIGLCSISGRIGGILSPIIANAGRKVDPALPFIVFGATNMTIGMLCFFLPETTNITLPATIQEAEDLEKYTFSSLRCTDKSKELTEQPSVVI